MKKAFEKITFPIEKELLNFEKALLEIIEKQDNFLKEEIKTFLFAPSKRLRVIFTFLFQKILKIENNKDVLNIALATELFHTASLIHDDILDEEIKRRENNCFYVDFGIKKALLEGDFLLSVALSVISKTNIDIVKIFSSEIMQTINGELYQNEYTDKIISKENYLKKTFDKTAPLFIAPLMSLFTLKEIEQKTKDMLIDFINNFSFAFQIKNDIDNVIKTGSDIKNGNYTLPMIYFFMENTKNDFSDLSNEKNKKYIIKAKNDVINYKNNAISAIDNIEESVFKKVILQICEFYFGE